MITSSRVCIFCGKNPAGKNNEHVLPQWLLEFTGDPNRIVTHWYDRQLEKEIRYSFSSFKFPACEKCNTDFSKIEGRVSAIIKKLNLAVALTGQEYILLLDWLDKVRIGMWLARMYLEKSFEQIKPNFFISNRVAVKDRAILVYRFPNQQDGLTALGHETNYFKFAPCVFGLRINQTLIINISCDAAFSKYLGCAFPIGPYYNIDPRYFAYRSIGISAARPLKLAPPFKMVVGVFQSIFNSEQHVLGKDYLKPGVSLPFLHRAGRISSVALDDLIPFDEVTGHDSCAMWQAVCYIYDQQMQRMRAAKYRGTKEQLAAAGQFLKLVESETKSIIEHWIANSNGGKTSWSVKGHWTDYRLPQI